MQKAERSDISYKSADGRSQVAGYFFQPATKPWCIVQIAHGMCEYILRYEEFANYLCQNGVAVCGNDHIGHGASAAEKEDYGYFTAKGGRRFALADMRAMNEKARSRWPGLPLVLLGHSMGSFFARRYAAEWPDDIDGLIISGTGGPNPLVGLGIFLTNTLARLKGPRYRSDFVNNIAFGASLKRIDNPDTPFDWISRDKEIARAYSQDPLCTYRFTVNGFHELFCSLKEVSRPAWAVRLRKDMPVLMIQGGEDPVGDYGKGPATVRDWLRGAGVKNLEYIEYEGARHEVLNETNRQEVYGDVLAFLKLWWQGEEGQDASAN